MPYHFTPRSISKLSDLALKQLNNWGDELDQRGSKRIKMPKEDAEFIKTIIDNHTLINHEIIKRDKRYQKKRLEKNTRDKEAAQYQSINYGIRNQKDYEETLQGLYLSREKYSEIKKGLVFALYVKDIANINHHLSKELGNIHNHIMRLTKIAKELSNPNLSSSEKNIKSIYLKYHLSAISNTLSETLNKFNEDDKESIEQNFLETLKVSTSPYKLQNIYNDIVQLKNMSNALSTGVHSISSEDPIDTYVEKIKNTIDFFYQLQNDIITKLEKPVQFFPEFMPSKERMEDSSIRFINNKECSLTELNDLALDAHYKINLIDIKINNIQLELEQMKDYEDYKRNKSQDKNTKNPVSTNLMPRKGDDYLSHIIESIEPTEKNFPYLFNKMIEYAKFMRLDKDKLNYIEKKQILAVSKLIQSEDMPFLGSTLSFTELYTKKLSDKKIDLFSEELQKLCSQKENQLIQELLKLTQSILDKLDVEDHHGMKEFAMKLRSLKLEAASHSKSPDFNKKIIKFIKKYSSFIVFYENTLRQLDSSEISLIYQALEKTNEQNIITKGLQNLNKVRTIFESGKLEDLYETFETFKNDDLLIQEENKEIEEEIANQQKGGFFKPLSQLLEDILDSLRRFFKMPSTASNSPPKQTLKHALEIVSFFKPSIDTVESNSNKKSFSDSSDDRTSSIDSNSTDTTEYNSSENASEIESNSVNPSFKR